MAPSTGSKHPEVYLKLCSSLPVHIGNIPRGGFWFSPSFLHSYCLLFPCAVDLIKSQNHLCSFFAGTPGGLPRAWRVFMTPGSQPSVFSEYHTWLCFSSEPLSRFPFGRGLSSHQCVKKVFCVFPCVSLAILSSLLTSALSGSVGHSFVKTFCYKQKSSSEECRTMKSGGI